MRDIVKESCNIQRDVVYSEFTTFIDGQKCVVKLKKVNHEDGIYVASKGVKYVIKYFLTMFFARRYFKKLRDRYPEEVKSR